MENIEVHQREAGGGGRGKGSWKQCIRKKCNSKKEVDVLKNKSDQFTQSNLYK